MTEQPADPAKNMTENMPTTPDPTNERATTPAHKQIEVFHLEYNYPEHEPRETDPHYHLFNEARKRLEKLGRLECWIDNEDCAGGIELHHAQVEFALANDVDVQLFDHLYPELHCTDDEEFLAFVESEGNLLPLCVQHHRGLLGIHTIHYPAWLVQRVMAKGVQAPERKVSTVGGGEASGTH